MITIDITMPIQIMNIIILIFLMNAVLYRPVRAILAEREKKVADMEKEIGNFNKNAKLRLEEFDHKMNEARVKAKAELEKVRGATQSTENEKLAVVRKEAETAKAGQLATIKSEFTAAQQALKGQINGFAAEMAGKILGRAL